MHRNSTPFVLSINQTRPGPREKANLGSSVSVVTEKGTGIHHTIMTKGVLGPLATENYVQESLHDHDATISKLKFRTVCADI